MPTTVLLSDHGARREVEVENLPMNVRAAVADVRAKSPESVIEIQKSGALYRIRMPAPANSWLDVLSVA